MLVCATFTLRTVDQYCEHHDVGNNFKEQPALYRVPVRRDGEAMCGGSDAGLRRCIVPLYDFRLKLPRSQPFATLNPPRSPPPLCVLPPLKLLYFLKTLKATPYEAQYVSRILILFRWPILPNWDSAYNMAQILYIYIYIYFLLVIHISAFEDDFFEINLLLFSRSFESMFSHGQQTPPG